MPTSSTRSSMRDDVARALAQPDLLAALDHLDQLADQDLDVGVRVVAGARGDRAQPVDVAVVVGAEQVDAQVDAALALVDVVGGVGGEVGQLAVGLDQDAVLVVVEVGGAQPRSRRRPRTRGPARAASRTRARRRRDSCSVRSEYQTSKCVRTGRGSPAAPRAGRGSRARGTRRAARRSGSVDDAGSLATISAARSLM